MEPPLPGTPIIIDLGGAYIKVGIAGEKEPRYFFPCITGTEKYKSVMADVGTRSIYVGEDAMRMRGVLKVSNPIQRGAIMDWNAYYEIINHIFYDLLRLEDLGMHPVLYTEAPFMQRETKEYIARVFFETHRVMSFMMVPTPLLSMLSVGKKNGLVIESGDGMTWIVPVINGQIYQQAIQRLNLGGWDVNQNLMALLMREGISITSSAAAQILKEVVEKNCYFVLDSKNPPALGEAYSFPMPDGSYVSIPNHILYQAPEVLFEPGMLGYNIQNLPQAVISCLNMISNEYWSDLLSNIILSGGNLSYSGFDDRFKSELSALIYQLGPIPKSASSTPKITPFTTEGLEDLAKKLDGFKLQTLGAAGKEKDNCPKCGDLVDLTDGKEFCPSCGASMTVTEISLDLGLDLGKKKEKKKDLDKCPHCHKKIADISSIFCPFCGKSVDRFATPEVVDEIIALKEETELAEEFTGFYEPDEIIKIIVPKNLSFSIFHGASILASLPAFQDFFITHQQFLADPGLLYKDISHILG